MTPDTLRVKMAQYMLVNIEDYRHLEAAMNTDMPNGHSHRFNCLEDRIDHMSSLTSAVGEMEICAMAEVLKQPIHVVLATDGHVVKYKDTKFPYATPIIVLYSSFGNNSGHYHCLVPSHISVTLISPVRTPQLQEKRRQGNKKIKQKF